MKKILVTGGAGFIGSNFVSYWLKKHPEDSILILDLLTYAANKEILKEFKKNPRIQFVHGDICDSKLVNSLIKRLDFVFHFAAETHVDRSILNSQAFLKTNVLGTQVLLEAARINKVKRFVFISTDEVYGTIPRGLFTENSPLKPNSPYAASKAAADLLCRSYWATYRFPVIITRCCNNFGPYQFPEKVIPLFVTNLQEGRKIPLYGKGINVREWIDVRDHCRALDLIAQKGKPGEIYNIGTGADISNIKLAKLILDYIGKPLSLIEFVPDRPGHDIRYALDWSKLKKLGWKPERSFKENLYETIRWYSENKSWWAKIKNKPSFQKYMRKQYSTTTFSPPYPPHNRRTGAGGD